MKFNLLLLALYAKLKLAARRNTRFIGFIRDRHLTFTIKTADGRSNRQYTFSKGRISSRSGALDPGDFTMVWSDGETGFKTMSSRNEEAPVAALTEKTLRIEGDFKAFMWFSRAMDIMMGKA